MCETPPISSEDVASSSALPLLFLSWSLPVDLSDQVVKYLERGHHKNDRDEEGRKQRDEQRRLEEQRRKDEDDRRRREVDRQRQISQEVRSLLDFIPLNPPLRSYTLRNTDKT